MAVRVSTALGGAEVSLETGKVAKQADGAVLVQQGETVVLVTAVYDRTPSGEAGDMVPLTVDYREKTYAAGKIPGGFFKREGRPTEKEILTARLIDRPIRPLFPPGFQHDLQVMAAVLSSDGEYDPDVLAIVGASAALALSPLPFPHPVAAVRIGLINGQPVVNPTYQQLQQSSMDLVLEASRQGILSLEGGFHELSEEQVFAAITFGNEQAMKLIALQETLVSKAGRPKAKGLLAFQVPAEVLKAVRERATPELKKLYGLKSKNDRTTAIEQLKALLVEQLAPAGRPASRGSPPAALLATRAGAQAGGTVTADQVGAALQTVERDEVRRHILESGARVDGRGYTQLRAIECEIGVLPRTHGSGLFTRGETQSLSVTTLGTSDDEQRIESLEGESSKRFMLHYNFPPFSVGEVRPVRSPGRREIGHGALAERALALMIPSKEAFPYTIRIVSDILESNGSSSMATVCAGTLSLMDAGVPIKAAVAGVAMGLVKEGTRAKILTDIAGLEDHFGDMDFKVAGTRQGITALQADVKLSDGLPLELIRDILAQAKPARLTVLDRMTATIEKPKAAISAYAPRIVTIKINPERIRDLIGPGGRTIRKIIEETGVTINVEDDGSVDVASSDSQKTDQALQIIKGLTEDVEVGTIYTAKVKRIMNFGAFCEILPGKEGLVRISELDDKFVQKVEDVVKVGDEIRVQVIEIDEQGRVNLSRKRLLAESSTAKARTSAAPT